MEKISEFSQKCVRQLCTLLPLKQVEGSSTSSDNIQKGRMMLISIFTLSITDVGLQAAVGRALGIPVGGLTVPVR